MTQEQNPRSQKLVLALAMVAESRPRMNTLSNETRAMLETDAREIIKNSDEK